MFMNCPALTCGRHVLYRRIFGALAAVFCGSVCAATAPVFTSGPSVDKTVAYEGETLTFTAVATTSNGQPATYAWNFGDGATGNGSSVTHIFVAPDASLNVQVTAYDGTLSTTASVMVAINAPVFGTGLDSDGDGFSDEFELEAGTDPNDSSSTPLNGIPAFSFEIGSLQTPIIKVTYKVGVKPKVTVTTSGGMLFGKILPPHRPENVYVVVESADGKAGFGHGYVLDSKGTGGKSATGSIKYKPGSFGTAQRPAPRKAAVIKYSEREETVSDGEAEVLSWLMYLGAGHSEHALGATGNAAVSGGVTAPSIIFATYGGNVFVGNFMVLVKKDSKGNFTATTAKP